MKFKIKLWLFKFPIYKFFHNSYKFGFFRFIQYKITEIELYKNIMIQYYRKHENEIFEEYRNLVDYNLKNQITSGTYNSLEIR